MADSKVKISLVLDAEQFQNMMEKAGASVDKFGKSTEEANTQTKGFSTWLAGGVAGLVAGLTTKVLELGQAFVSGIVEGAQKAVESFRGFEKGMANVNSIAQLSKEELGAVSDQVNKLAVELGKSPKEMSEALFDIYSAGLKGAEAMKMLEDANRLAIAGATDTKTAAGGLMTAMALYKDEIGSTAVASDKLAKANEIGRTTIGELSKEFGRIGSTAKTAGASFNETMAALAALTLKGQETNLAATNLQAAFTEIVKPGEKLAEVFEGVTGKSIQAYTAANGFSGTLKALYEITGGSTEQLGKLGLSQGALSAITALADNQFRDFDDALKQVNQSAGATQRQFDAQAQTLDFTIKRWEALKEVIFNQIGEKLAPVLTHLVEIGMQIGNTIRDWLSNKDNIAKLNELIDASKVAITVMMQALKDMATVFTEAFSGGEDAARKSGSAIDTVIGFVKLLSIGFKMLVEFIKPTVEVIGDMARTLGALAEGRWSDAMKGAFETIKDAALATHKTALGVGKAMIESANDYDATMKRLKEGEVARAQKAEADKVAAAQEAEAQTVEAAKKTAEAKQHFQKVDVDQYIEAQKEKEKAAKDAAKNALKSAVEAIKDEYDRRGEMMEEEHKRQEYNLKLQSQRANKYGKQQIAMQKLQLDEQYRLAKEAMEKEEDAKLDSLKKQGNAAAAMNAGIYKNTTETMSATVEKINSSIDNIAKTRAVQVNGKVSGLEALDGLKGGTINVNGNLGSFFDQLDKFLIPRIHADNKAIYGELVKINANTKLTADKIPAKATL